MMTITLAVVAYNEEKCLPLLLDDIRAQSYPHDKIEILLVDSFSEDKTRKVMEDFAGEGGFCRVDVFDNPGCRQSTGWNVAIDEFLSDKEKTSKALVRVDAHARIPSDFVFRCVEALGEKTEHPENVVGGVRPTICESDSAWSKTLWMAEESMFGSSTSSIRRSNDSSGEDVAAKDTDGTELPEEPAAPENPEDRNYVKTVFHACYRREVLEKLGGFREDLGRTEDNEFHYRIRKNGYRIYCSPYIYSEQYVRPTLRGMLKQKAGNGFWIGRTLGIVPGCISLYHLVPFAFVMAILGTIVLCVCGYPVFLQLLTAVYASAAVLMAVYSAFTMQRHGDRVPLTALLLPFIFLFLHVSYGSGTLIGLLSIPFGRSSKKTNKKTNKK